jgi:hypothetical protein
LIAQEEEEWEAQKKREEAGGEYTASFEEFREKQRATGVV